MKTRVKSYDRARQRRLMWLYLLGIVCLLTGVLVLLRGAAYAQETEPPPRDIEREAPEREPVILETRILSSGIQATLFEVPAAADAYIASGRPNQNFEDDALFLGYNAVGDQFGAQRILLRFDVDSFIPENAVIHNADLRLRLNFATPSDDTPMPTLLRRLASDWTEDEVTWNTEPTWAEIRDDTTEVSAVLAWYSWDITTLVDDWLDGTHPNYGVEIIGDEDIQERERTFYSRETPTDYFPRLVIEYTVSDDSQPPIVTVDDLPSYSRRSFTVSWDGFDQGDAGIAYYDVQYRVDGDPWTDWLTGTTMTEAEFVGEDGRFYEFRARGVDDVGNTEDFAAPEAGTTVDNRPPTSTVDDLPALVQPAGLPYTFTVSWTGMDAGSGIQHYNVYYRFNDGLWTLWQDQTMLTSATFEATQDGVYGFEVWAVDNLGQRETFFREAEASTIVDAEPPYVVPRIWMPLIFGGGG